MNHRSSTTCVREKILDRGRQKECLPQRFFDRQRIGELENRGAAQLAMMLRRSEVPAALEQLGRSCVTPPGGERKLTAARRRKRAGDTLLRACYIRARHG